jgi:hypothetical protein
MTQTSYSDLGYWCFGIQNIFLEAEYHRKAVLDSIDTEIFNEIRKQKMEENNICLAVNILQCVLVYS